MRILVISNLFPPDYDGGLELSAAQLARGLRQRAHEVNVLTSRYRDSYVGPREEEPWIHRLLHFAPPNRWAEAGATSSIRGGIRGRVESLQRKIAVLHDFKRSLDVGGPNFVGAQRLLQQQSYDLAYCFGLHQVSLATTAPVTERGIPLVWHTGDYWLLERLRPLPKFEHAMRILNARIFKLEQRTNTDNVLFISEAQRRIYAERSFRPQRWEVIPRSIDFEPIQHVALPSRALDAGLFFMACRLSFDKGVSVAIEAARKLRQDMNDLDWSLEIAGPGVPEMVELFQRQIADAGLSERVKLLGKISREETLQKMRSATAFLSTSLWEEPFGRTNIEAMACGAPLIASKTGAIFEIVGNSECALLYDKEDAAQLAAHMQAVLTQPELAETLARKGLARVREAFTMDRILDRTEDFFERVLAGSS
jgi:glycogen synthase